MTVGFEIRGIVLGLIEGASRRRIGGRGKHGLACLGRDAGIDGTVRHALANPGGPGYYLWVTANDLSPS